MKQRSTIREKLKVQNISKTSKGVELDVVYETLIGKLELSQDSLQTLISRGFSKNEIEILQYKTFPTRRRELVDKIVAEIGRDALIASEVPGFYINQSGDIDLAGRTGIAIPLRNPDGKIHGIKIRVDNPSTPASKYLLLSSNPSPNKKTGEVKYVNGTAAKAKIHWPLARPKVIQTLRITEGEFKADIATSMTDTYTISLPGISVWRLAIDAIKLVKPQRVLLSFDSDKGKGTNIAYDKNAGSGEYLEDEPIAKEEYIVGKAVSSLYLSLRSELANLGVKEICIEDWPDEVGKGIDDVLLNGATDKIRILSGEDADAFAHSMLAEDLPDGWVYVIGVKRFYHAQTLLELDKEQYSDRYAHSEKGSPSGNALRNPALPKVDLPIYMPNREIIYEEHNKRFFNTWRPGTLLSMEGDVQPFLDHCAYVLPDKYEREIFLDWLAFNVQNHGVKILWAVLLKGEPGTGKSYFGALMRWMLGDNNVSFPTNEMIHEIYTAWVKSCQMIIIEEIMARGRMELMNKLKPMITQPTTIVREMHKPAYEQPNVFNILMFSNHDDALLIDKEDRRYCVLFSPAKPKEHTYYADLWDWTKSNLPAILHWFKQRDLSNFKNLAHAPMTKGKTEIISEGMTDVQAWVIEGIAEGSWPFVGDLVGINHLVDCAPKNLRFVSRQNIAKALKTNGAVKIDSPILLSSGSQVRLWSIRRHEMWASAERETLAAEYERWSSANEPGGNPLLEAKPM